MSENQEFIQDITGSLPCLESPFLIHLQHSVLFAGDHETGDRHDCLDLASPQTRMCVSKQNWIYLVMAE